MPAVGGMVGAAFASRFRLAAGHGVIAMAAPGMAAPDAARGEDAAFDRAV